MANWWDRAVMLGLPVVEVVHDKGYVPRHLCKAHRVAAAVEHQYDSSAQYGEACAHHQLEAHHPCLLLVGG